MECELFYLDPKSGNLYKYVDNKIDGGHFQGSHWPSANIEK